MILPDQITEEFKEIALEKKIKLEYIKPEYGKFVEWWRGKDLKDADRAWSNWLRKAVEFKPYLKEDGVKKVKTETEKNNFIDPYKNDGVVQEFRSKLKHSIGEKSYDSWFETPISQDDEGFVIHAKSLFFRDYIDQRFLGVLKKCADGKEIKIIIGDKGDVHC